MAGLDPAIHDVAGQSCFLSGSSARAPAAGAGGPPPSDEDDVSSLSRFASAGALEPLCGALGAVEPLPGVAAVGFSSGEIAVVAPVRTFWSFDELVLPPAKASEAPSAKAAAKPAIGNLLMISSENSL
jgi:hypothetical protein